MKTKEIVNKYLKEWGLDCPFKSDLIKSFNEVAKAQELATLKEVLKKYKNRFANCSSNWEADSKYVNWLKAKIKEAGK